MNNYRLVYVCLSTNRTIGLVLLIMPKSWQICQHPSRGIVLTISQNRVVCSYPFNPGWNRRYEKETPPNRPSREELRQLLKAERDVQKRQRLQALYLLVSRQAKTRLAVAELLVAQIITRYSTNDLRSLTAFSYLIEAITSANV
jgi:hypothetical protein